MRRSPERSAATSAGQETPSQVHGTDGTIPSRRRTPRSSIAERLAATEGQLPSPPPVDEPKERLAKGLSERTSSSPSTDGSLVETEASVPRMYVRRQGVPNQLPERDTDRFGSVSEQDADPDRDAMADRTKSDAGSSQQKPLVKFTLRIDPLANSFLRGAAFFQGVHMSTLVRMALDDWLVARKHPTLAELSQMTEKQVSELEVKRCSRGRHLQARSDPADAE